MMKKMKNKCREKLEDLSFRERIRWHKMKMDVYVCYCSGRRFLSMGERYFACFCAN